MFIGHEFDKRNIFCVKATLLKISRGCSVGILPNDSKVPFWNQRKIIAWNYGLWYDVKKYSIDSRGIVKTIEQL